MVDVNSTYNYTYAQAALDHMTFRDSKTKCPTAVVPNTDQGQSFYLPLKPLL